MPSTQQTTPPELTGESFDFLRIYMRDHDGASSGGLDLARRCHDSNKTSLAPKLEELVATLTDAQATLCQIAERLDIRRSLVREAATLSAPKSAH